MWYTASLLFRSDSATSKDGALWEESIVLIEAETEQEALSVAEQLGRKREHSYISATGNKVHWALECVERVHEIIEADLASGTELFSRFLRDSEARSLMTPIDDRESDDSGD